MTAAGKPLTGPVEVTDPIGHDEIDRIVGRAPP